MPEDPKPSVNPASTAREREFCNLAAKGDVTAMKAMLKDGVSPNAREEGGSTALTYAISGAQLESVKILVEAGADINQTDRDYTPLGRVRRIIEDNSVLPKIETYLLSHGATETPSPLNLKAFKKPSQTSGEMKSPFGKFNSALSAARGPEFCGLAGQGDIEGLKAWLKEGVSPNSTDQIGSPALKYAISGRQLESIQILVEAGANVNQANVLYPEHPNPLRQVRMMIKANDELLKIEKYLLSRGAKEESSRPVSKK